MDPLVGLHVDFLDERLAAKLAREFLLLEMNLLVALPEMALSVKFVMSQLLGLGILNIKTQIHKWELSDRFDLFKGGTNN